MKKSVFTVTELSCACLEAISWVHGIHFLSLRRKADDLSWMTDSTYSEKWSVGVSKGCFRPVCRYSKQWFQRLHELQCRVFIWNKFRKPWTFAFDVFCLFQKKSPHHRRPTACANHVWCFGPRAVGGNLFKTRPVGPVQCMPVLATACARNMVGVSDKVDGK